MSALVPAAFVARPNRFIVRAALDGGGEVDAHLADPGRLRELLVPGAPLRLRPATGGARRTAYTVALVRSPDRPAVWVCVETTQANRLAGALLAAGDVRGAGAGRNVRAEVRHGASRFDFLLEKTGAKRLWVEVKSVTLVEGGLGLFPDAPTSRGRRHVTELADLAASGDRAMVLFVAQREDAQEVRPHDGIDPEFAAALRRARQAGVVLRAVRFRLDARGRARFLGEIPVRLHDRR